MFKTSLTQKEIEDIYTLKDICYKHDKELSGIILDEDPSATDIHYNLKYIDGILVSAVSYIEFENDGQISAMTHPSYRNRGYVKEMISEIHTNVMLYYTICKFMDSSRHKLLYSEYCLTSKPVTNIKLSFNKNNFSLKQEPCDDYILYTLYTKDNIMLGHLKATYVKENVLFIWNVYIEKEYRNQKFSYILFLMLYETLDKNLTLCLQVSSTNTYAYNAYIKLGFTIKEKLDYFVL